MTKLKTRVKRSKSQKKSKTRRIKTRRSKSQKKNRTRRRRTRRQRGGCWIYDKLKGTIFSPAIDVVSVDDDICSKIIEQIQSSPIRGINITFNNENDVIIYKERNKIHICKLTQTSTSTGNAFKLYMYDCNELVEGATTEDELTALPNIIIFDDKNKDYEKIKIDKPQTCIDFLNVVYDNTHYLELPVENDGDSDDFYTPTSSDSYKTASSGSYDPTL